MKKVLVFGTFDLLHPGHLHFLRQARCYGQRLIVVVSRDNVVKKLKRRSPLLKESDRLAMVKNLRLVDQAFLGDRLGECRVVTRLRPKIIAYGYDQKKDIFGLTPLLAKLKIRTVQLKPWRRQKYSSTKIRNA